MRVMKFGGSSVADAERIKAVCKIITDNFDKKEPLFVVVSAFGGITDTLIETTLQAAENKPTYLVSLNGLIDRINSTVNTLFDKADVALCAELKQNQEKLKNLLSGVALIQEASTKTLDYILSFGERNAAYIISKYLVHCGVSSSYIDAREYIKTDNAFGSASVSFDHSNKLIAKLKDAHPAIHLITGFIGSDNDSGRTTTLGRGGSDYTAAIFAAALDAELLEIWTDVDGVLTSDPRKVKKAYTIPEMSFSEALEMSHFGAKVLYAPTVRPVRQKNIPILIKNTFNPQHQGTKIHNEKKASQGIITGLSSIQNISIISIQGPGLQGVPGIASRFFSSLAQGNINIIMITQASSEHSISVAIKSVDVILATSLISSEFEYELRKKLIEPINVEEDLSLLAVIGENMKERHGVAGKLFNTLGKNGINIEAISQGSSELNITFAVKSKVEGKALNTIHDSFFLSDYKTVHLFVVGIGLIGSKLLELLAVNQETIKKSTGLDIVINGISNSKKYLFNEEGIELAGYKNILDTSGQKYDLDAFVSQMINFNFAHSIFVDNTANNTIPGYYRQIIESNIAISTPNKIAMSSDYAFYKELKALALRHNTPFRYETNVAAGLPVISTLENLINSGDQLTKIEAVLSGSLSYIFNNFSGYGLSFSEIVKQAQLEGLTEPDPREDLSGADVKRKLLILARDAGYCLESEDIIVENILSQEAIDAKSVDAFFDILNKDDAYYHNMLLEAEGASKKLRFIAEFSKDASRVSLKHVGKESPFYALGGSDNMIVLHSQRYSNTPLVIRGPGAGADVTAAGILAEIINLGNVL